MMSDMKRLLQKLRLMIALAPLAFAFVLPACSGSLEAARSSADVETSGPARDLTRCYKLDDRKTFWGGVGQGGVVLSGGAGLATVPVDDPDAQTALAISSAGVAAVAAIALYVSESSGESWARECAR